ncbi:hypothetical protein GCM10028833_39430 [Glycomyces tarimensis]
MQALRVGFYDCLTARANALFELTDALLCPWTQILDRSGSALTTMPPRARPSKCAALSSNS